MQPCFGVLSLFIAKSIYQATFCSLQFMFCFENSSDDMNLFGRNESLQQFLKLAIKAVIKAMNNKTYRTLPDFAFIYYLFEYLFVKSLLPCRTGKITHLSLESDRLVLENVPYKCVKHTCQRNRHMFCFRKQKNKFFWYIINSCRLLLFK